MAAIENANLARTPCGYVREFVKAYPAYAWRWTCAHSATAVQPNARTLLCPRADRDFPDLVGTLRFPSYWALPRNTPTRLPPAPRSSGPASRADRGVRNEHRRHIAALLALGRSVDDIHELYKTHVVSVERVLDKGTLPKRDGCLNDAPTHRAFGSKADTGLHPARVRSLQKRTCQLDRAVSVKGQPRTSLGRLGGPFLHPGSRIIFWLVVLAVRKP
jgi:hypothetical protein